MNNKHLFTPEEILRSQRVIFKYRNGAWPEDIIGPNWRPDPSDMSFWKGVDPESLPKPTGATTNPVSPMPDDPRPRGTNTKVDGMDAMPSSPKESSISNGFLARGLSQSDIDDMMLYAMSIDDVVPGGQAMALLDNLSTNPLFLNPEDLLTNLKSVFSKGNVNPMTAKNLLNEFKEGSYWMSKGESVHISKKWSKISDEVDVTVTTQNMIVECKNISAASAGSVRDNIQLIIDKFSVESKLSLKMKELYPNHFGKIDISNKANPYFGLSKDQFVNKLRSEMLDLEGGISKSQLVNSVKELHVENGTTRFIISSSDW